MYGACIVFYEKIASSFPMLSSMKKTIGVGENVSLHNTLLLLMVS